MDVRPFASPEKEQPLGLCFSCTKGESRSISKNEKQTDRDGPKDLRASRANSSSSSSSECCLFEILEVTATEEELDGDGSAGKG